MNVEIGTDAAQFPEKEYINGIFVAVCTNKGWGLEERSHYRLGNYRSGLVH
jgi:hypothetical protein